MSLRRIGGFALCLMALFVMGCGSGSDSTAGTSGGTACWIEASAVPPGDGMDGLPEHPLPDDPGLDSEMESPLEDSASGTSTFNPGDGTDPPPLEGIVRIAGMDENPAELKTNAYDIAIRGNDAPAIMDDTLTVTLSRGGGCKGHDFTLVVAPAFRESEPVQLYFTIVHDNHGDTCEAYLTDRVAFDLVQIKDRYQTAYPTGDGVVFLAFQPPDDSSCGYDGFEYDTAAGASPIKIGFIVAGERPTYLRSAPVTWTAPLIRSPTS